jgi:ectoine hydrolase
MNFTKEEYKNRLKKVQNSMQEKGIELLISHDTANMNYLTGYDAWSFYYAQAVVVHVDSEEPLVLGKKTRLRGGIHKNIFKK